MYSFSVSSYILIYIAQRMKDENLSVVCVPTSYQARQLIIDYKLTLGNLDTNPKVSIKHDITYTCSKCLNFL